jgi:hypothetical protein
MARLKTSNWSGVPEINKSILSGRLRLKVTPTFEPSPTSSTSRASLSASGKPKEGSMVKVELISAAHLSFDGAISEAL